MIKILCPVCKAQLEERENAYVCVNGHNFDKAKEGYCNLLLANEKNSKNPGDNAVMVAARRDFLNKGYYRPLAEKIEEKISAAFDRDVDILDAGAGTGYYACVVSENRCEKGHNDSVYCVDISKYAAKTAAKALKKAKFFVAGVFALPFEKESLDAIFTVFAPFAAEEFARVIKPDGRIFAVTPGENHLVELRRALYGTLRENETHLNLNGTAAANKTEITYKFDLKTTEDISALVSMTPYLYKTPRSAVENLTRYDNMEVTADFILWEIKK